jgi:hypothetical protein
LWRVGLGRVGWWWCGVDGSVECGVWLGVLQSRECVEDSERRGRRPLCVCLAQSLHRKLGSFVATSWRRHSHRHSVV